MYRAVFWTLWEKVRVGWFERIELKHVYYHMWNRSPVQVRCMRQGAQGWCTGMTLRDGMGRVIGGRFMMGNTCTSMANSCQCMAKPLQYCKVISLQLNKFKKINCILLFSESVFQFNERRPPSLGLDREGGKRHLLTPTLLSTSPLLLNIISEI